MLSQSQRQGFPVLLEECGVSVQDESLRAASPLRSSAPGCSAPRFDWRHRAASRSPSQGHGHKLSCDRESAQTHVKRLVPQQLEIQPGGRFYHEVNAYEDRWVIVSCSRPLQSFLSQIPTIAGARTSRGRKGNARKIDKMACQKTVRRGLLHHRDVSVLARFKVWAHRGFWPWPRGRTSGCQV
jgi:hypothetical protein